MTDGPVKSPYFNNSNCSPDSIHGSGVSAGLCTRARFLSPLQSLSGLTIMLSVFCLDAYSVIKLFSLPSIFVERLFRFGRDFCF